MEKPHALIVEDDRDIAALFRHVLDLAGYRTEIVMDGREAVERLKVSHPDVILLDLTLPGIPGAKILEYMRGDGRLADIPIVVVSAHAHIAGSLAIEPDLVLLKPVNLNELSNLMQRLRSTPPSERGAPWDPITHLYNSDFFKVRLTYSLERAKKPPTNCFGVVFVDVTPFNELRKSVAPDALDIFLREIAGHLKKTLRPTDTVARADDGLFLILLEDIPEYASPAIIAERVAQELAEFVQHKMIMDGLRTNVGLILCDAHYETAEEVLGDVDIARKLIVNANSPTQYERTTLMKLRTDAE